MLDMAHQFFNRRPPAQIAQNVGDRMTMKLRRDESEVTYVVGILEDRNTILGDFQKPNRSGNDLHASG